MNISAPSAARGCKRAAFLPTTRTFCPRARRFFATTFPVLPLAPRTTYMLASIFKLDAADSVWAPRVTRHSLCGKRLEARVRIELTIEVLQTSALPLGYRAECSLKCSLKLTRQSHFSTLISTLKRKALAGAGLQETGAG